MKGNIVFCLLCFVVFMIFAVCTACGGGGGGGGASLYDPNSGPHNGGGGGSWNGAGANGNTSSSNGGGTTPNATIVLTGGTSLGVQYYTYKGQNYYSAQDLLDVLGNENITGTVDIPLVAADGSSRVAKYVVTDRGRTLKHPYKITLNNTDGTALFGGGAAAAPEYFYASDGFPMSKITTKETPVTINGSNVDFPITAWNINGATVAADGTLIGFGEGTTLEAAPVAKKYFVDNNGTLYINPTAVANGETIKITAADGPISHIEIDSSSRVALDLSDANIVDGSGNSLSTWTSSILNTECANALTSIKLPQNITAIASNAFDGYNSLQSVTLQNGVTSIGTDAFKLCSNLTSINIPNGVTTIANGAFAGAALKSVTIPASVNFIDDSAFDSCYSLESVTFNGSLTFGTYNIFKDCISLTSINLPEGITEIPEGLFRDCTNLKHVGIPSTVTTIGCEAFKGTGLTSIVIPPSVTSLDPTAFDDCSALKTATVPIGVSGDAFSSSSGMKASVEELKLTKTIETEIPDHACEESNLVKVNLPEGITKIGEGAFQLCDNLTEINIPNTVTDIETNAFTWSSNLKVSIPSTVINIGPLAFNGTAITEVIIREGTTVINYWSYGDSTHIKKVVIPDSVITIQYYAFAGCTELQTVTIGSGVQTMEQAVFNGCVNAYFIFKKNPQSISYINYVTHFPEGAHAEWTDNGVTHTYHWHWTGSSGSWILDS